MKKVSWFHLGIVMALMAVLLVPQAGGAAAPGRVTAPSTPITVALSLTSTSGKGGTAEVSCKVSSTRNISNVVVRMTAKGGATFLSSSSWNSALTKGVASTFTTTLALNKEGNGSVTCTALGPSSNGTRWGDMKTYYFNVTSTSLTQGWGKTALAGKAQLLSPDAPELAGIQPVNEQRAMDPAAGKPGAPAPLGTQTAGSEATTCYRGYWYFYDRGTYLPPADPATTTSRAKFTLRPLQRSSIYLYDYDYGLGDDYLGATITDDNGYWSFCTTNPQADGDYIDLYFRAYMSNTWWTVSLGAHGTGGTFYWYSPATRFQNTPSGVWYNVGAWYIPYTTTNYMAAWLFNDLNRAIFYFTDPRRAGQGAETSSYTTPGYPAWIKWSPSSTDGTYYSFSDDTIHLMGNDPRTYSASTHEYGHRIMNIMYPNDDWPNGYGICPSPHYYNGVSSQSCAFSEGWADAVALLVPNDALYRWASGATANNETRAGFSAGDAVEGNIAATYWDWMDVNNDNNGTYYDTTQFSFDSFLRAIDVQDDDRFLQYWQYWKSYSGVWCAPALRSLRLNINSAGYACP
ncbi:MAG: hypothetical protein ACM3QS_09065 [Bacteroidota bacterium]